MKFVKIYLITLFLVSILAIQFTDEGGVEVLFGFTFGIILFSIFLLMFNIPLHFFEKRMHLSTISHFAFQFVFVLLCLNIVGYLSMHKWPTLYLIGGSDKYNIGVNTAEHIVCFVAFVITVPFVKHQKN